MLTQPIQSTPGKPVILVHEISFEPPQTGQAKAGSPILKNLSASFSHEKTGLVGKNGIGKTTLIRLLVGEIQPTIGEVERSGSIAYLPQDLHFASNQSVSDTLGVTEKLAAIQQVKIGHKTPRLIETIGQDWDLPDRVTNIFAQLGSNNMELGRKLETLSGGERTKVILASLLVGQPDFLILDEPTNNLDADARSAVYQLITDWPAGLLIVSHDRHLLNLLDRILELSEHGLKEYGGNYDFYEQQRELEDAAARQQLHHTQKKLKQVQKQAQTVKLRQQKRTVRSGKMAKDRGIPRIVLGAMKRRAEATTAKLKQTQEESVTQATESLEKAQARIRPENQIRIDLANTRIPSGKLVAELKNIDFTYPQQPDQPVLKNYSLSIYGPERIAIAGPNGSGKTTLVKVMLEELNPLTGEVRLGIEHFAYLDQHTSNLDRSKTLLGNLEIRHPGFTQNELRAFLSHFLFHHDDVFKLVQDLSGGEKIRAALAVELMGAHLPQLLVLDEPTNNLDLDSIERLESALANYHGALVVISHDQNFLENIGIERRIALENSVQISSFET